MTHIRSIREKSYVSYIKEKSKLQRIQRRRAQIGLDIEEGRLIDKEEALKPWILKIRQAMEQALSAGVPRTTVERIVGILDDASEGIGEDSSDGKNGKESV